MFAYLKNKVDLILIIVHETFHLLKIHLKQLYLLEHPKIEELLKLLVTVVDAELLVAVEGEEFKSCDVQHADVVCRGLEREALIDAGYNVIKKMRVDSLGQGIASIGRLLFLQRHSGCEARLESISGDEN